MKAHLHRVYGIYAGRTEAGEVLRLLLESGFAPEQLELMDQSTSGQDIAPDSDEVRNEVLVDGAVGTAVGAGVGALGEAALAAANISLFIASPVIGTLAMMGWGAALGGIIGAAAGAGGEDKKSFSDLVDAAVESGHTILIANTDSEAQTTMAQKIIGDSMQATQVPSTDSSGR